MGVAPSEAGKLTLYEYGALLHFWNKRNSPDEEEEVEAPDFDIFEAETARLIAAGVAAN
ncbi:hypothetical protein [Sphingomonas paeninsulae]|uniref:hypothetical protein n=1 Tax=Sphingomonas paeninsulae TaxID=2319844 RepID=UPI0013CE4E86|nr:hypothetical protein [Sphingomonas paeninsulae]